MSKWLIIFLTACAQAVAQSPVKDCRTISNTLDYINEHYYWGSPRWLAKMDSVINQCSESARAWGDKAMIYALRGEFSRWNELMKKAVALDPGYYLGNRAWHRMRYLQDYAGALYDLQKLDTIAGFYSRYVSDCHSHMLIALCKEGLNDYQGALESYDFSIAKQIRERGAEWVGIYDYLHRGVLRYKMGDWSGALTDFNEQIKMYEKLADVYYFRGLVYQKMNESELAHRDFLHAKELMQGSGFTRWNPLTEEFHQVHLSDIESKLGR